MIKKVLGFRLKLLKDQLESLKGMPIWQYPLLAVAGLFVGVICLAFCSVGFYLGFIVLWGFFVVWPVWYLSLDARWLGVVELMVCAGYIGYMWDKRIRIVSFDNIQVYSHKDINRPQYTLDENLVEREIVPEDPEYGALHRSNLKLVLQTKIGCTPPILTFLMGLIHVIQIPMPISGLSWLAEWIFWPFANL